LAAGPLLRVKKAVAPLGVMRPKVLRPKKAASSGTLRPEKAAHRLWGNAAAFDQARLAGLMGMSSQGQ